MVPSMLSERACAGEPVMRRVLVATAIASIALTASAGDVPLPSEEDQAAARAKVRADRANDFIAAGSPSARIALSGELANEARRTIDTAERYALFSESLDLAIAGGRPTLSVEIAKAMAAEFDVDGWELQGKAYVSASLNVVDAGELEMASGLGFMLTEALVRDDSYATAADVAEAAQALARRTQDRLFAQLGLYYQRQTTSILREANSVSDARATLEKNPDDADANTAVGLFLCIHAGDWTKGLPMLAKGSDLALAKVADRDLESPTQRGLQALLGDTWWEFGERRPRDERDAFRNRASIWYQRARGGVSQLKQRDIDQKMSQAPSRFALLFVSASVDGKDEIRIRESHAELKHLQNQMPDHVRLNGVPWDVRSSRRIENEGLNQFLPEGINLRTAKLIRKKGRMKVNVRGNPGETFISLDDPQPGASKVDFLIQYGE